MFPKDWQGAGLVVIVNFPDTAAFVYQAIHGAFCMETDQLQQAIRLATTRVQRPFDNESRRLFEDNDLIGWPDSLEGSCIEGWKFISNLSDSLPWLTCFFGDTDSYKASLYAYYLALNVLELVETLVAGLEEKLVKGELWTSVPICPLGITDDQQRKAYRLLTRNPKALFSIWEQHQIPTAKMKAVWPQWIQLTENMISKLGYWISAHRALPHKKLFEDLVV